ncbi:MAG: DUF4386 domain-containing protein [Acidimicrobiales bacterium]
MSTIRTARTTGAFYLALAVTGMLGFLVLRPRLFTSDAAETLGNLADNQALAHSVVLLEMLIVISQATTAVWFFKLFRTINPVAAFATAAFGLVNAVAIMMSAAFLTTAIAVASDQPLVPGGNAAGSVGLLQQLSESSWGMGNLFFGLWLIPMGWAAIEHGRFPKALGALLIAGGAGYLVSALLHHGVAGIPTTLADSPAYIATVAEFWMIGYLLTVGIRPQRQPETTTHGAHGAPPFTATRLDQPSPIR